MQLHDLAETGVVLGLGTRVRLDERTDGALHQTHADPVVANLAHDGTVLRVIGRERPIGDSRGRPVGHDDPALPHRQFPIAIAVLAAAAAIPDRFEKLVYVLDPARGVHPAAVGVESLVDEELSPGDGAVRVESLVARHLQLGAKVERHVRVDEQERVVIERDRGGDRDAVRT